MTFTGFPTDSVKFLAELERHNNRPWFQANRERYEHSVRGPAVAFIEAMEPRLEQFAPHIYADPSPSGGSLKRIYRNTRFSPDKTPYKTNIGIQFLHEHGEDAHAQPVLPRRADRILPGLRDLAARRADMAAIRKRIVERPDNWVAARRSGLRANLGQRHGRPGQERLPRSFDPQGPNIEDIKGARSSWACWTCRRELLHSPRLLPHVACAFAAAGPLMKFLCKALSLPY